MKRFWHKTIILAIIPLFVFVSLACCCFTRVAQAHQLTSSCHSVEESHQGDDSSNSAQNCDCMHKNNFLVQNNAPTIALETKPSFQANSIFNSNGMANKTLQDSRITLAYQGPPEISICSLPIYLQNSNLRI